MSVGQGFAQPRFGEIRGHLFVKALDVVGWQIGQHHNGGSAAQQRADTATLIGASEGIGIAFLMHAEDLVPVAPAEQCNTCEMADQFFHHRPRGAGSADRL